MNNKEDLLALKARLKCGEYDGNDIMQAWIAIDELIAANEWIEKAFQAYPNIDLDIKNID